jgi:hypothetical protein
MSTKPRRAPTASLPGAGLAALAALAALAGCSPEPVSVDDRAAATCQALGDWRARSPEARQRILTGVGGLEGEALARTEFLLGAADEALTETAELAEFLAELTGGDAMRLLESPDCIAARATLEAQLCPLAVAGSEDALARQRLAELSLAMQEACLLELDSEDALPVPQLP